MKIFRVFANILAIVLPMALTPAAIAATPDVTGMQLCENAEQLDCIQSLEILDPSGSWVRPEHVSTQRGLARKDDLGNQIQVDSQEFDYQGLHIGLSVELESRQHRIWVHPDGKVQLGAAIRAYLHLPEGNLDTFRLKLRTSWMKPQDIQIHAEDGSMTTTKIPGGNLWSFVGKQQKAHGYDSTNWQKKLDSHANADWEGYRLEFLLHHTGKSDLESYFPIRCAEKGYTIESHNAPGAGMPAWDEGTKSLQFNIISAHADKQGKPVVGYFRLWVSEAYIDCMWPMNTITNAAEIQVLVANEDGTYQVASTVVGRSNGQIRVEATGFHYSSPTVMLRSKPKSNTSTFTGFGTSTKLSSKQIVQAKNFAAIQSALKTFVCVGTYEANAKKSSAEARAKATCQAIREIRPEVRTSIMTKRVAASQANRVLVTAKK